MKLLLAGCILLSSLSAAAQTISIRQSEIDGLFLKSDFEKHSILQLSYKNGEKLQKGSYIIHMDEEGGKNQHLEIHLSVNDKGQPDGTMQSYNPDNSFVFSGTFQNGALISYSRKNEGQIIEEGNYKNDTCYIINYDEGKFQSEYRYVTGETVYSKSMNLSGWDIQDMVNGTRTFYYGTTDKMEERITYKNLPEGVKSINETYDEDGRLNRKEVTYDNGKTKNIFGDGSYEINTIQDNGSVKVEHYSKEGKLTESSDAYLPMAPAPSSDMK